MNVNVNVNVHVNVDVNVNVNVNAQELNYHQKMFLQYKKKLSMNAERLENLWL